MGEETPQRILLAGAAILAPMMKPYGFVFKIETHGKGSENWFTSGTYCQDDRRLELHFRYTLGLVTYHIGCDSLDHEIYMRLLGVYGTHQYPDFPRDPLESFHHLAADIQKHCQDFTVGDGSHFHSLAQAFEQDPAMFKGIP